MVAGWGKRAAASLRAALQTPIRAAGSGTRVVPPPVEAATFPRPSALGWPSPRQLAKHSSPWSLLQRRWTTGAGKGVPVSHAVSFPKEYRSRVAASAVVTHKWGPDARTLRPRPHEGPYICSSKFGILSFADCVFDQNRTLRND